MRRAILCLLFVSFAVGSGAHSVLANWTSSASHDPDSVNVEGGATDGTVTLTGGCNVATDVGFGARS